jgi:hypothetical protein
MASQFTDINTIRTFLDYAFQQLQTILDRIIGIENTIIEAEKSTNESTDESADKSADLLIRDIVEHLLSSVCGPPVAEDGVRCRAAVGRHRYLLHTRNACDSRRKRAVRR